MYRFLGFYSKVRIVRKRVLICFINGLGDGFLASKEDTSKAEMGIAIKSVESDAGWEVIVNKALESEQAIGDSIFAQGRIGTEVF